IVLGNKEWMACCSASAGPAFEGSGVACGMRAAKGAIEKVKIDTNLDENIKVIGDQKPMGICGSGYVDLISEMFKRGIIRRDGKIDTDLKTKKIRKADSGYEYVVV